MTRWFEDIVPNEIFELGQHTFTAEEIAAFAQQYDPQYFHIDADAAQHSHFNGQIASGWHTVSMGHRLLVNALDVEREKIIAAGEEPGITGPSPGVNKMEFKHPVRPGDTIAYSFTVTSKRPSKSLPGWGLLLQTVTATNQNGDLVYRAEMAGFTKMRDFNPNLKQRIGMMLMNLPILSKLLRR